METRPPAPTSSARSLVGCQSHYSLAASSSYTASLKMCCCLILDSQGTVSPSCTNCFIIWWAFARPLLVQSTALTVTAEQPFWLFPSSILRIFWTTISLLSLVDTFNCYRTWFWSKPCLFICIYLMTSFNFKASKGESTVLLAFHFLPVLRPGSVL